MTWRSCSLRHCSPRHNVKYGRTHTRDRRRGAGAGRRPAADVELDSEGAHVQAFAGARERVSASRCGTPSSLGRRRVCGGGAQKRISTSWGCWPALLGCWMDTLLDHQVLDQDVVLPLRA